jgi:hypothetical protein
MGKAAKLHRKKVAARNQKVQAAYRKAEAAVREFIEQSQKAQQVQEARQSMPTLGSGPVSAIQAATSEKNNHKQI